MSNRSTVSRVVALLSAVAAVLLLAWLGLRAVEPAHAAAPPASTLPPLPDAGTIRDDPTVAPDPKQSADKNLSLPADI